jgi:hypothetical protein
VRTELAALLAMASCTGCTVHDPRPTLREISLCEPPTDEPTRQDWCQWPRDVRVFANRYDVCQHFLGEEPYDDERRRFLGKSIDETCTGNDKQLRKLRSAYAGDPEMTQVLDEFDFNTGTE